MLRELQEKDAPLMLRWMHDADVTAWMEADFASKTLDDCLRFIAASKNNPAHVHMAIVDENDTYMGTTSLKNIDRENGHAEFAITICKEAMGKGLSKQAMADIIAYGLEKIGLEKVYWYVRKDNQRAVRFYDKNQYPRVETLPVPGFEQTEKYVFYCVEK